MNVTAESRSVGPRVGSAPAVKVPALARAAGCFLVLLVSLIAGPKAIAQPLPITGPVAMTGHGGLFDSEGKEIKADTAFILRAQRTYLDRLLERSPQQLDQSLAIRRLRATNLSLSDRSNLNAESIATLIEDVKPPNAAQLRAINVALRKQLAQLEARRLGQASNWEAHSKPSASLTRQLLQAGLKRDGGATNLVTNLGGQAYVDQCRTQGVPIPPAWGSPEWKKQGRLGTKFIIANKEAEVWTFEPASPRGICIALPRFSSGEATSDAFGIICQGNDTSKACFWDNRGSIPLAGNTPLLPAWKGGVELLNGNGVCTDCHAGENPYIVHPGTPLDRGNVLRPNSWVDPLVDASWPQNPGPTQVLDNIVLGPNERSCLDCHSGSGRRFPAVSTALSGYCGTILGNAYRAGGTMPPGNAGDPAYAKHVQALRDACQRPPRPTEPPPHGKPVACSVFDDGATNLSPASEAIYFAGNQKACIPDGTGTGNCRKWFGRCKSVNDNVDVTMRVFNDGGTNASGLSDAIFNGGPQSECVPNGTGTGNCRKWFGLGETTDRKAVECYLFNDGLSDWVGPTNAIFVNGSNQVCMPDGTGPGTCRKWFGNCQVGAALPPLPAPPKEMNAAATPLPMPVRRAVRVRVNTVDAGTGQPIDARIEINGQVVANSNVTFTYTFVPRRVGTGQNAEVVYPVGIARATGYRTIQIDFEFPD